MLKSFARIHLQHLSYGQSPLYHKAVLPGILREAPPTHVFVRSFTLIGGSGMSFAFRVRLYGSVCSACQVSNEYNCISPRRTPHPRLYHQDVLSGIWWVATLMLLFFWPGTLIFRSCISHSFLVRLYGSVLILI